MARRRQSRARSRRGWLLRVPKVGETYGYAAAVEEAQPLEGLPKLKHTMGKAHLVRARLGVSRAGKDGTLPVFFADYPYRKPSGPAWIDGIALRPAQPGVPMEPGIEPGARLHLALRAGDSVTIRRELEMDADVNAFDEENLTPLFYAAAVGDAPMVRQLLEKGADPNQAHQSIPPLSAAATSSSVEVVKLLLDAGAELPLTVAEDSGKLAQPIHPAYLHPVVAAIRAGSLPVLKLLMARAPELDIQSLVPFGQTVELGSLRPPTQSFILDAMMRREWEMAGFLIDHGCQMLQENGNLDLMGRRLIARAAAAGEGGLPAVEALLRRGVSPIYDPL